MLRSTSLRTPARVIHSIDPALLLAVLFVVSSTTYAVLAFRNFSVVTVVLLQALFVGIPFRLLQIGVKNSMPLTARRTADYPLMVGTLSLIILLQFAALIRWQSVNGR
jgi:hypothetical protein